MHACSDLSMCLFMHAAAGTGFTTPVTSNRATTASTSSNAIVTGVTLVAVAAAILFLIFAIPAFCICRKKFKQYTLTHERYTTQPTETLRNSYPQGDLALPMSGGANSNSQRPALPCPAYTAQDLPPDYYEVSKDKPPDYFVAFKDNQQDHQAAVPSVIFNPVCSSLQDPPTTQCHSHVDHSTLSASAATTTITFDD